MYYSWNGWFTQNWLFLIHTHTYCTHTHRHTHHSPGGGGKMWWFKWLDAATSVFPAKMSTVAPPVGRVDGTALSHIGSLCLVVIMIYLHRRPPDESRGWETLARASVHRAENFGWIVPLILDFVLKFLPSSFQHNPAPGWLRWVYFFSPPHYLTHLFQCKTSQQSSGDERQCSQSVW